MKICKECKWVGDPDIVGGWSIVRCLNPEYSPPQDQSPVTGVVTYGTPMHASTCRFNESKCGPEAKGFEQRSERFQFRNPIKRLIWSIGRRTWMRYLDV